jgi:hypothetical protein
MLTAEVAMLGAGKGRWESAALSGDGGWTKRSFLGGWRKGARAVASLHKLYSGYRQVTVEETSSGALDLGGQSLNPVVQVSVLLHEFCDLVHGV